MRDCPVCCGSRKVRLPWMKPMAPARYRAESVALMAVEKIYQDYPCPECAPSTNEDRVAILEFGATVAVPPDNDPRREEAIRREAAFHIVDRLLKDGFISFREDRTGEDYTLTYEVRGRLGVVSPAIVASMEERIAERQADVARQVAVQAAEEIRVWGSYYTGDEGPIHKGKAVEAVQKALDKVLAARRTHVFRTD
jgi:hypothetical protein